MSRTLTFRIKKSVPFNDRKYESSRMVEKYPDRVPCIIEHIDPKVRLDKSKYLVPVDLTVGQFIYVIRKRININDVEALFMFTATNVIPPTSCLMGKLHEDFKDEDGFLYLKVGPENVFG